MKKLIIIVLLISLCLSIVIAEKNTKLVLERSEGLVPSTSNVILSLRRIWQALEPCPFVPLRAGSREKRRRSEGTEPYNFRKNGKIEKEKHPGFVDVELEEKELDDELVLYTGRCTWRKGTGAEGKPVQLPVKAFLIIKEEKRLRPIATYFTQDNGKFYFVLPKEHDYSIGPVTSKALNMPKKVRKFFFEWFRHNRGKENCQSSIFNLNFQVQSSIENSQ